MESLNMREYKINCSNINSRLSLHCTLSEALSFPGWYGNNLDALYDCLTDMAEPSRIVLEYWQQAEEALGDHGRTARMVMELAAKNNPALTLLIPETETEEAQ